MDEVRLRFTQSRDIRAPNLQDLFSPPQANHNTIPDPFNGNQSTPYDQITQGNSNLLPEKANTTGLGVVYQPEWLSGFNASVDYYRINNKGAIQSPGFDYVLGQCFAGVAAYCAQVERFPAAPGQVGILKSISRGPQNQASQKAEGLDFEVSYRTPLDAMVESWNGDLGIRIVANHALARVTDSGIAGPTQVLDEAGFGSTPKWNINTQITYSLDAFRFTFINRWISKGRHDNTLIECASNCPSGAAISGFRTVNRNYLPSYNVSSATLTYRFYESGQSNAEAFVNVDNIFDRDPPVAPNQIAGATYGLATNASLYDTLGRRYRAGIRFRM
jgi:iron complex outermembrane recepter protein